MTHEPIKGHCPTCGGERLADVEADHAERWDEGGISYCVHRSILKCRGCETVYVRRAASNDDDVINVRDENGEWEPIYPEQVTYWPAPTTRTPPKWVHALDVDHDLKRLYEELYAALNNDLRVLAAIGVRTVFDRVSAHLGIDPALTFADKLAGLEDKGSIGADERAHLNVLTEAGNAAAHQGWRPTPQALETLVETLEAFLYRTLVLGDALKVLKAAVPGKPRRRPKPASVETPSAPSAPSGKP